MAGLGFFTSGQLLFFHSFQRSSRCKVKSVPVTNNFTKLVIILKAGSAYRQNFLDRFQKFFSIRGRFFNKLRHNIFVHFNPVHLFWFKGVTISVIKNQNRNRKYKRNEVIFYIRLETKPLTVWILRATLGIEIISGTGPKHNAGNLSHSAATPIISDWSKI